MAKDIRIELLQNRQNVRIGSQILSNAEFNNSTGWTSPAGTCTGQFTFPSGRMIKTVTGAGCARATLPQEFVEGYEYRAMVAVKNYNGVGNLLLANHATGGANVTLVNSTIIPSGTLGTGSSYRTIQVNWIQGSSNTTQLSVYANDGTSIELGYLRVYRTAVDKSSVFGILDASTTEDFPLSINFSVNDPANIDARKGAYSKTFEVPATKNNNKILKNFNIANSTHQDAQLYNKIDCRIIVGNLFSLTGLLQIKSVERLNDKPVMYSCIFLGDNLYWSTNMEGKYLSDLQLENSTNLKLSAKNIIDSWQSDNATDRGGTADTNTSPVVYPLTSYGRVNETGFDYGNGFQLFREKWEIDYVYNNSYNNSQTGFLSGGQQCNDEPVMDWRPLVWIYRMMHKIFNDAGYTISSNFMETNEFKRLVYASPNFLYNNPNERKTNFTYIGNFKDGSSCATSQANLKFFDDTQTWTFNVTNTVVTTTYENTMQTPYGALKFGGTCGSGNGSGRFQPLAGNITTSAGQQQLLTISAGADGWGIPEAGFYRVSTSNIMYFLTWSNTTWAGAGQLNNSTSGMTVYGNIVVQVKRVGMSNFETISIVDNQSANSLGGFQDNNHSYAYGATLDASSSTHYFNAGDLVQLTFGVAPKVKVRRPADNFGPSGGITTVDVRVELFGTTYDDWDTNNAGAPSGLVSIELVNEDTPVWGGTYDLQNVFPKDQKQIDFVKGVAHAFNLQFSTEEASKTVFIEPYTDYYLPPRDAIDWSHKLARNLSDNQSFIDSNWARKLIFKYKTDDKDWRVNNQSELYFDDVGDNYPQQLDLPDTYPAGETIFENPFFAGTYDSQNFGAGQTNVYGKNFYTAALWKASYWYSSTKGYEFKPRMLYYNKMTMPVPHGPLWQGFNAQDGSTSPIASLFNYARIQIADVTVQPQSFYLGTPSLLNNAIYCSATFIDRHNFTNQFGLSYGNYWAKDYDPATNTYTSVGNEIGKGLYERYYKTMIEGLQARPKLRVCYMDLKITDIVKLDFRKMVYIDGVYYRLIRVVDFQPHKNEPTKVELHQFSLKEGVSAPTAGEWINNNQGGAVFGGGIDEPVDDIFNPSP